MAATKLGVGPTTRPSKVRRSRVTLLILNIFVTTRTGTESGGPEGAGKHRASEGDLGRVRGNRNPRPLETLKRNRHIGEQINAGVSKHGVGERVKGRVGWNRSPRTLEPLNRNRHIGALTKAGMSRLWVGRGGGGALTWGRGHGALEGVLRRRCLGERGQALVGKHVGVGGRERIGGHRNPETLNVLNRNRELQIRRVQLATPITAADIRVSGNIYTTSNNHNGIVTMKTVSARVLARERDLHGLGIPSPGGETVFLPPGASGVTHTAQDRHGNTAKMAMVNVAGPTQRHKRLVFFEAMRRRVRGDIKVDTIPAEVDGVGRAR